MIKTQKRIQRLAEMVELAHSNFDRKITVADIGTDHGYLAEKLSKMPFVESVVATDISEKSLSKLKNLIEFHTILGVKCVFCDGLTGIDNVDVAVVAGIGGEEIIRILSTQTKDELGNLKCRYFVLNPTQNVVKLRRFIFKEKYKLIRDVVIEDAGRFYQLLLIDIKSCCKTRANIYNLYLGRDNKFLDQDFNLMLVQANEFLKFLDNVSKKQIAADRTLLEKYKLRKIVKKLLEDR